MLEFINQIKIAVALLPDYLVIITLVLVIVPTLIGLLLRFSLYRHLVYLGAKVRKLLGGIRQGKQPALVENLEQRLEQGSHNLDRINTAALIDSIYSQEKFRFLFFPFRCEQINYFTRMLPNLLLAFGLFGTFLGITINLASLSQTIGQVSINDVSNLVQELNQPLQGMGIAFITSLIAISCSALLTLVNLFWNTNLAKSSLIGALEDYLDNVYLPQLPTYNPLDQAVDRLSNEFNVFLAKFGETVQETLDNSLSASVHKIVAYSEQTSKLAQQVYKGFMAYSESVEKGANSMRQAADTIEQSRFAQKLASATTDLAVAQNRFTQSSLVLKKSTQSMEDSLIALQRSTQRMVEMTEAMHKLNQKQGGVIDNKQPKG